MFIVGFRELFQVLDSLPVMRLSVGGEGLKLLARELITLGAVLEVLLVDAAD